MPHYLAGQYLGAFLASSTVFLLYWDALVWYEHDRGTWRSTPETAGIFSTFPGPHLSLAGGILDQTVVTALLLTCVCAITDRKNMKVAAVTVVTLLSVLCQVSKQCVPLFIGLTVLAIGISFGYNCGYAINPARDLAPRLFTGEL